MRLSSPAAAPRHLSSCPDALLSSHSQTFCEVTEEDFSEYRVDWIRQLISAFADRDDTVVEAAWLALEAMVKTVPKDELENLVVPLRTSIESTAAAGVEVPGFSRPKGVQSIVPILLAGVLGGCASSTAAAHPLSLLR